MQRKTAISIAITVMAASLVAAAFFPPVRVTLGVVVSALSLGYFFRYVLSEQAEADSADEEEGGLAAMPPGAHCVLYLCVGEGGSMPEGMSPPERSEAFHGSGGYSVEPMFDVGRVHGEGDDGYVVALSAAGINPFLCEYSFDGSCLLTDSERPRACLEAMLSGSGDA